MDKKMKKKSFKMETESLFEEIDHRLASGWHSDPQDSAQRKRYVRELKMNLSNQEISQISKKLIDIQKRDLDDLTKY